MPEEYTDRDNAEWILELLILELESEQEETDFLLTDEELGDLQ